MQVSREKSISTAPKLPPELSALRPEFFRLPKGGPGEVDPHFGFSRSFYYVLEKRGKLKLHRVITSGREKGIVVIRYADVLAFIESQIAQQEASGQAPISNKLKLSPNVGFRQFLASGWEAKND